MIEGIHHIALIVSSGESISFYEKLGFTVFYKKQREYDLVILMRGYGIELELFVDSKYPEKTEGLETLGIRHLALKVDDIETVAETLELEIGPIQNDWMGIRFAYVKDPDGILIELHE